MAVSGDMAGKIRRFAVGAIVAASPLCFIVVIFILVPEFVLLFCFVFVLSIFYVLNKKKLCLAFLPGSLEGSHIAVA